MDSDKRKEELLGLALKIQEANPLLIQSWFYSLGEEDRVLLVSALLSCVVKAKYELAEADSIIPEEASL